MAKIKRKICYQAKKLEGKVLSITDMPERDKRFQRKKWREAARKYRKKKKQETNEEFPQTEFTEAVLIVCE